MSMNLFTVDNQQYTINNRLLIIAISTIVIVENIGVEPMTSCVQGRRSSQLS